MHKIYFDKNIVVESLFKIKPIITANMSNFKEFLNDIPIPLILQEDEVMNDNLKIENINCSKNENFSCENFIQNISDKEFDLIRYQNFSNIILRKRNFAIFYQKIIILLFKVYEEIEIEIEKKFFYDLIYNLLIISLEKLKEIKNKDKIGEFVDLFKKPFEKNSWVILIDQDITIIKIFLNEILKLNNKINTKEKEIRLDILYFELKKMLIQNLEIPNLIRENYILLNYFCGSLNLSTFFNPKNDFNFHFCKTYEFIESLTLEELKENLHKFEKNLKFIEYL